MTSRFARRVARFCRCLFHAIETRRKRFNPRCPVMYRRRFHHPASGLAFGVCLSLSLPACTNRIDGFESNGQDVITTNQINGNSLPAKTVVWTFDDGPDEHTLELAKYMNEQGIHLTFFMNGR